MRVDGSVHAAPEGLRSTDVGLEIEKHEQDGVSGFSASPRSDPRAAPIVERFQCDDSVVLLELQALENRSIVVTARCFASTQHEFDVLSQRPRPARR